MGDLYDISYPPSVIDYHNRLAAIEREKQQREISKQNAIASIMGTNAENGSGYYGCLKPSMKVKQQ